MSRTEDLQKIRERLASTGTSRKYTRASEEELKKFYDTVQNNVNSWFEESNNYFSSATDYYKGFDDSDYNLGKTTANEWYKTATSRGDALKAEADNINKILSEYSRYFDSEWISQVRLAMSDTLKSKDSVTKKASDDLAYWDKFNEIAKESGQTPEEVYTDYYLGNKYNGFSYEDVQKAIKEGKFEKPGEMEWLSKNADAYMSPADAQAEMDKLNEKNGFGDENWFESKWGNTVNAFDKTWDADQIARQRYNELITIKSNAERKEKVSTMVAEAKSDPLFNDYVKQGEAFGLQIADTKNYSARGYSVNVNTYESGVIASKKGLASGNEIDSNLDYMEEDEYQNYAYLLGKYGKETAEEYFSLIQQDINTREAMKIKGDLKGTWVLPELFGLAAGIDQFFTGIESLGSDGYKAPSSMQIASGLVREDLGTVRGVAYDVLNTGGNMVPSIITSIIATYALGPAGLGVMGASTAGKLGSAVGTMSMGASAGGNAYQEMLNLGYNREQAATYGVITGISEASLQYILGGVSHLSGGFFDDAVKGVAKGVNSAGAKWAIEFGADMAGEFTEEFLQEVLDPFFKTFATGQKYEGVDLGQAVYAGMLGALSAGVLNGIGAGANRLGERSVAKDIKSKEGWVDSVKNLGNTFSADTLAYKLASKVDENTSVGKLATLIHEMHGTLSEQNVADIKYQLMRNGVMETDADTISKYLAKAVDGDYLTAKQRKALDTNPVIQRVFKKVVLDQNSTVNQRLNALMEMEGKVGHAGVDYSAIAKSQSKEALSASATLNQYMKGAETDAIKAKYNLGRSGMLDTQINDTINGLVNNVKDTVSKAKVSESGATTNANTGKQISINRVATINGKTATFALADGTTISNKDVEYADSDEGLLYEGAISLGYDANITNAIIQGKKGVDLPVGKYLNGIDEAIEYGRIGYPMDKISTEGFFAELPKSMQNYAYNLGKESAKADVEKAQAKVDANKGKVTESRKGEVVKLYEKSGLSPRQEASLDTLGKVVSDITNNKVYVFESVEKTINGKKVRVFANDTAGFKAGTVADNGFINKATGEIYIDLHAGANAEGVILWTLAHELTHFVRQWSPAKFNVLADFLMAEYGKQGVDVRTLIDNKIASSQRKKLSRDEAYEEVVADAMQTMFTDTDLASKLERLKAKDRGLWNKIKQFFADLYKRVKGEYKDVDVQTWESAHVRKMSIDTIERISNLFAEGIVDAGDTFASVGGVMTEIADSLPTESTETTDPYNMVATSYRSFAEACGFEAYEDPDTSIRSWRFKGTTDSVKEVTEQAIRNSPVGALINYSATKGYISYEDATEQYKMFASIANMCIKQQDFAQAMQFVGSMVFTGMKANADKQYGTTYDFPSICTKTQAVIDAMSDAMIKKGAGLTKIEIKLLYDKVWAMGNPVPCPECYVFSRWVGIGGLLDNIKRYQDTYSKMTMAEVEAEYQKMKAEIEEYSKANNISFGKAKGKIFDLYAKEEAKLMEEIAKLEEAGDPVPQSKTDRLAKISLQKNTTKAMSWIHKVYFANESHTKVNPKYLVPNEVLFDLNAGETFATKYREAWAFRTTQGAGYGKAITPYAEAVLGEGIKVTNSTTKTIKGKSDRADISTPQSNIFLEQNGTLSNAAIGVLETARKKQLTQAFIGGQRLQSTSDARYENVTDYLIAAIEMQAMHSKAQVYTKVSGAVEAFSNWGFAINQSLMPLNSGLNEDGTLADTSSGGMKTNVAYANRTQFENAGTITIGVNDKHIRTLFRERGRDFIIPYHASGGDQTLIREFRRIQDSKAGNETFVQSCDYSKTQSEKELPNALLRELGYTDEQIADVEKFRQQRLAILTGKGTVDLEYIRAEGNEVLGNLYDALHTGEWKGVLLTKDKVGTAIFPNEYWDKSVDYDNSSKITEDYLEYCRRLGFLHKFSGKSIQWNKKLQKHQFIEVMGYNENGERVALTDLAYIDGDPSKGVEQFYWKTLTDRRMYGNDGKYLEQKFVTLGNADASVAETFAKNNEGSEREYSKEKSDETLKGISVKDGKVSVADNMMMSERTEAPTFYSHMGRVIDGIKQTKMGAKDVLNYLTDPKRGVKDEEIKWSGIEAFLEGKKSVTKEELQEFVAGSMLEIEEIEIKANEPTMKKLGKHLYEISRNIEGVKDVRLEYDIWKRKWLDSVHKVYWKTPEEALKRYRESSFGSQTRWNEYKLEGGTNYRELVFKMPNSSYTNPAMEAHWEDEGVLAHTRVQDFETTDGKKMLFVEEIQSDWHNEGHKQGYDSDGVENGVPDAPFRNNYHEYVLKRLLRMAAEEGYDSIGWTPAYIQSFRWSEDYEEGYRIEYDQDIPSFLKKYGKKWGAKVGKAEIEVAEHIESGEHYDAEKVEVWSMDITDSMKDSVLYEGQVMYSERILMGSLFSGGGTLEAGLTYQMLDKQFGVEYDGKIASVYASNHGDHIQVGKVEDFDISKHKDIFYLHASPVCHNFSTAKHGAKELQMDIDSAKATAKHLETAMPQVFTVENAPGYRKSQSLKIITDKLTELGYKWDVDVYNSADYGSATSRNRVILRAVKDGELPAKPTKQERTNSWDKVTRDLWNTLPKSSLRPSFISAIENTKNLKHILSEDGKVKVDRPLLLITTTSGHTITYSWEGEICPTLTTKCGEAKLVMPDGNIYAVTPEFMGRIQGLPDDYKYPKEKTRAFTIIGNGIPTHLTKAVVGGVLDSAYEQTHNGDILYSERNSTPVDNRSLLANALESVAQNPVEQEWLAKYKSQIAELNEKQNKLAEIRAEIHKIRSTKGADRSKLTKLEKKAKTLANSINYADKKLLQLEASKALKGVVERERAKAYKRGKAKADEYRKDRADSTARNYYRPRMEKIVSDLSNRLAHPTAKTAIPEAFGASVAKVLSAFNFTTYDKNGTPRKGEANVTRAEARESLKALAKQLGQNSIENTYGQLDIPPAMLEWIEEMATHLEIASNLVSDEFTVNKMNEEQLKVAYKLLRSLQTAINNAGKYYTNASSDVAGDARNTIDHVGALPTEVNENLEKATKILKWDFASPVTVFDRFGDGGKNVYKMLVKGQSKMANNSQTILDFVDKAYTAKEAKEWRETLTTVTIGGTDYNVPVEMLMGLHCLLKQEDSRRHILEGGGIRFGDVKHKGKVTRFENVFFNEIDAMAVEKKLDEFPRARECAEAIQKFMQEQGSSWGNEISMTRFGYHAFTKDLYYPIRTVKAGSEYEAQQKRANIYALLNKSFTKERNIHADNAVIVDGIFSVFNSHMAEMALYNAWALPVIDTIKWFNYKETQDVDAKKPEKSVHETFRLAYGTYADEYVRRLLESINSQTDNGLSEEWAFINLRKVNRVAVSWNVRVGIQQPFSVTRAFELINPKYVTPLVGKARREAYNELLQYSGIALWKSLGYYDADISRPMEAKVLKNESLADKVSDVGMKAAEDGDQFTWTALWNACKKETAEKISRETLRKEMAEKNEGADEKAINNMVEKAFLNKVAERFDDLVLRTQVVDSVLTKPQWQRSKGFWHKSTSAFMSEPLASYNALLRHADMLSRDTSIHGKKFAVRKNAKGIVRATGVFLITQLVNAMVTAPLDGLRDDDDYETYLEKVLANFKENAMMNLLPTSLLPYVSDIVEYAMYGRTDRADLSLWVSCIDLGKQIWNLCDPDKYSYQKLHKTFNSLLKVGSQLSGFAVSNVLRDVLSVYNAVVGELGYGELKFQTDEDTHTEGYKRMYDALVNGNEDRMEELYGQLLSNELDEEKVYNGLIKLVSKDVQDGNITDEEAIERVKEIINITGKVDSEGNPPTDNDIYWMIDKWKYQGENGSTENYSKYDDIFTAMEEGDPSSAIEWHIENKTEAYVEEARRKAEQDGKAFNEVKARREAKKNAESSLKSAITSHYKKLYKDAYKNGDEEEMKRIRYMLKDTGLYGSTSDLLKTCKDWLKS